MASITKRTTSTGEARYDVRWRIHGDLRKKTFRRRQDADRFRREVEADELQGIITDPRAGLELFEDYSTRWLDARPKPIAPRTREMYSHLLRKHVWPTFGALTLSKITPEAVRLWHARVTQQSTEIQAAKSYRLLRAILATAESDGLIGRNPARIPGAGQERTSERPIVGPDVVLDLADAIKPELRLLVLFAGFVTLRRGELCALQRRHIDTLHRTVTVEAQLIQLNTGEIIVTKPKTRAAVRTIVYPEFLAADVDRHLAEYVSGDPTSLVFTGDHGGPLRPARINEAWWKARQAVGHPELHFHDLRHAAATMTAQTGATLKELMARLGHTTPRAALIYQHATEQRDREIADRLDVLIRATERKPLAEVTSIDVCHGSAMDTPKTSRAGRRK